MVHFRSITTAAHIASQRGSSNEYRGDRYIYSIEAVLNRYSVYGHTFTKMRVERLVLGTVTTMGIIKKQRNLTSVTGSTYQA